MAKASAISLAALYYIGLPFLWLAQLLWNILATLVAPFVYLGYYAVQAISWPFRFLAKFETLYIYFGVALLVGVLVGATIHYIAFLTVAAFRLDKKAGDKDSVWVTSRPRVRASHEKKPRLDAKTGLPTRIAAVHLQELSEWPQPDKSALKSPSTLMSSTILEEDDSSISDTIEYV